MTERESRELTAMFERATAISRARHDAMFAAVDIITARAEASLHPEAAKEILGAE